MLKKKSTAVFFYNVSCSLMTCTAPAWESKYENVSFFITMFYAMLFRMMKITNTVTGKREIFKAQRPQKVTLYVCGVTPYDAAHIGHGRCYTAFDLLYRLLLFLDFEVVYCRNFTDIDDKLLNRAHKELGDRLQYKKIADRFIKQYHEDMKALNCLSPKYEPRVTDHIPEIISFISGLIEAGHAYESDGDVYFDITSFSTYGKLSKHKLEDIFAGARVQINEKKKMY